jgi:hypothetical protein
VRTTEQLTLPRQDHVIAYGEEPPICPRELRRDDSTGDEVARKTGARLDAARSTGYRVAGNPERGEPSRRCD